MYLILFTLLMFLLASLEYIVGYATKNEVIKATIIGAIIGALIQIIL